MKNGYVLIVAILVVIAFSTWRCHQVVRCHNAGGEYVQRADGCNSGAVCVQSLEEIRP